MIRDKTLLQETSVSDATFLSGAHTVEVVLNTQTYSWKLVDKGDPGREGFKQRETKRSMTKLPFLYFRQS